MNGLDLHGLCFLTKSLLKKARAVLPSMLMLALLGLGACGDSGSDSNASIPGDPCKVLTKDMDCKGSKLCYAAGTASSCTSHGLCIGSGNGLSCAPLCTSGSDCASLGGVCMQGCQMTLLNGYCVTTSARSLLAQEVCPDSSPNTISASGVLH
jgi:hypothetical protein